MHVCMYVCNRKPPDKCEWNRKPELEIGLNRQTARL